MPWYLSLNLTYQVKLCRYLSLNLTYQVKLFGDVETKDQDVDASYDQVPVDLKMHLQF
jgi:hypothetical protein